MGALQKTAEICPTKDIQVLTVSQQLPVAQAKDIGNDDQLFWAFTAMSAAELNFPDPPAGQPGWLELAQSVMNQLIRRYDTDPPACKGGLRWQNLIWHPGFEYKNTAANGGMFQLGIRLAKYTGNRTYEKYALQTFDWMMSSPLIDDDFRVNDGTNADLGCIDADHTQWTYNYGIMIGGAAYVRFPIFALILFTRFPTRNGIHEG
jgi:hypothetical protein